MAILILFSSSKGFPRQCWGHGWRACLSSWPRPCHLILFFFSDTFFFWYFFSDTFFFWYFFSDTFFSDTFYWYFFPLAKAFLASVGVMVEGPASRPGPRRVIQTRISAKKMRQRSIKSLHWARHFESVVMALFLTPDALPQHLGVASILFLSGLIKIMYKYRMKWNKLLSKTKFEKPKNSTFLSFAKFSSFFFFLIVWKLLLVYEFVCSL